jgi:SsrA-binding protein
MAGNRPDKPAEAVVNRRARHLYEFLEVLETGIALEGTEVKALRAGQVSLAEAFVRVRPDGLWLEQAHFAEYAQGNVHNHEAVRPRRLLVHRKEAAKLQQKVKEKGLTLVPVRMYFKGRWAKVEIALARGRQLHDKRAQVRDRDAQKDIRRHLKGR